MKTKLLIIFTLFICYNTFSQTSFAALQNIDPNTGNEPYRIASGDLDGDGIIDLAMATYDYGGTIDYIKWYKNDGSGNFTIPATTEVSSSLRWIDGLAIADVDGLFGDDIIATSAFTGKLVYFPSTGTGFGAEVQIGGIIAGAGQLVTGDINNDGNIDIALVAYDADRVLWFSGDGSGNFTAETDIANSTSNGPFTIDIIDYDFDNDLDIVVGFYNTGSIEIYYNQYDESGTMTVSWIKDTVTVDSGSSYLLQTIFADVNNDGIVDVAKVDNTTGDVEWFNKVKNGASTMHTISNNTIIARPGAIAVEDVDNDNIDDVILTDSGTANDAIIWFKGADSSNPSTTPSLVGDNNHQIFSIAVEDFDYDGFYDIAYTGNGNDTVNWYENEWDLLSLNDNEFKSISIYPNPARNSITINGNFDRQIEVTVYDVHGKEIITSSLESNNTLDISYLNSGFYFMSLNGSESMLKFIKQ